VGYASSASVVLPMVLFAIPISQRQLEQVLKQLSERRRARIPSSGEGREASRVGTGLTFGDILRVHRDAANLT
jgi:hypothetical protein